MLTLCWVIKCLNKFQKFAILHSMFSHNKEITLEINDNRQLEDRKENYKYGKQGRQDCGVGQVNALILICTEINTGMYTYRTVCVHPTLAS